MGRIEVEVDVEAELCKKQRVRQVHYFFGGGWLGGWVGCVDYLRLILTQLLSWS